MDVVSPDVRSRIMASIPSRDTQPERIVRSILHRAGYRFRKHVRDLPGSPDIVFPRIRLAVFIDGDFWHGYMLDTWKHKLNQYWRAKIERNVSRDRLTRRQLRRQQWMVLSIWEHQIRSDAFAVASGLMVTIDARRSACITD